MRPLSDLMIVDEKVSGKSCSQKVDDLRKQMIKKDAKWLVVTALDDIACELLLIFVFMLFLIQENIPFYPRAKRGILIIMSVCRLPLSMKFSR